MCIRDSLIGTYQDRIKIFFPSVDSDEIYNSVGYMIQISRDGLSILRQTDHDSILSIKNFTFSNLDLEVWHTLRIVHNDVSTGWNAFINDVNLGTGGANGTYDVFYRIGFALQNNSMIKDVNVYAFDNTTLIHSDVIVNQTLYNQIVDATSGTVEKIVVGDLDISVKKIIL